MLTCFAKVNDVDGFFSRSSLLVGTELRNSSLILIFKIYLAEYHQHLHNQQLEIGGNSAFVSGTVYIGCESFGK
jgi:hypothetical protein